MISHSFGLMATVEASTKRAPAFSAGKRGTPETNLASVDITPLMPLDAELRQSLGLANPHELVMAFAEGADLDIEEGDVLVVDGAEYPIRRVEDWPASLTMSGYKMLVVEDQK